MTLTGGKLSFIHGVNPTLLSPGAMCHPVNVPGSWFTDQTGDMVYTMA